MNLSLMLHINFLIYSFRLMKEVLADLFSPAAVLQVRTASPDSGEKLSQGEPSQVLHHSQRGFLLVSLHLQVGHLLAVPACP